MYNEECEIGVLVGKTLAAVQNNGDELLFTTVDGEVFKMYHSQDCCERVTLEDVCGDFADLIGSQILVAESAKGGVTLRWFGSSNGYYSESVDFERVRN